jgi:hypothetical protein
MKAKTITKEQKPLEIKSFKQNRPPLAQRTKLQKAEARAQAIVKTETREKNKHFNKQFNDYVDRMLVKGNTKEQAVHMAKAIYQ